MLWYNSEIMKNIKRLSERSQLTNALPNPSLAQDQPSGIYAAASIKTEELPALINLKMIRNRYVPLSDRTIFRMISAGTFPKADVQLGGKVRLWKRATIESWIDEQSSN